jgi:hypothetical protein
VLLKTDQTVCYDESGKVVDCRNSGQDAEVSRFSRILDPKRFEVRGDIVMDGLTGLIWHIDADLPGFPLTWNEAFEFVEQSNVSRLSGIDTWRLPTRQEMFSLLSHQHLNPCLPSGHPFRHLVHGYYWTGTECARLPDQVWYVHMGGGKLYRGMKHASYLVWPVSGKPYDRSRIENRFGFEGDIVTDRLTGRYWHTGNTGETVPWREALDMVARLNQTNGTTDRPWRLPNVRELESLVDDQRHSPAFADGFPLSLVPEGFWSSTTSVVEPRYAWVLYTRDGAMGVGFKPKPDFGVLAVHG